MTEGSLSCPIPIASPAVKICGQNVVAVVDVVVQSLGHILLFGIPWTAACQAPLFSTICQSLLKFMSIELVMLSNHLILCCPSLLLPSVFPSIRVFPKESVLCIKWPKYWASTLASVLPVNIQGSSPLGLTDLISSQSKRLSRVFSSTVIWKHQFFGTQPSLYSSCHICTWLLEML